MRFIHVADLHLGKRVHEYSMIEDQRIMLASLLDLCREERPDALLMAGDIYDKSIPSLEAMRLLEDFLLELSALDLQVMIIAGNHDSGERLAFGGPFFKAHKLHLAGVFSGRLDRVDLMGREGPVSFHLLPFVRPADVRPYFPDQEISSVSQAVSAALSTMEPGPGRQVLMAHQFVTCRGQTPLRSDSEVLQIGSLDQMDASVFQAFDYVALGHLHRMQQLGQGPLYYSGSPLAYSFSEIGQTKGALLVDLAGDGRATVRQVPLKARHAMRRIQGKLDVLLEEGRQLEVREDPARLDYLEIILTDQEPVTDPMNRLKSLYPQLMRLRFERDFLEDDRQDAMLDGEDLRSMSLLDLFSDFFLSQTGRPLTDRQRAIVKEAADRAQEKQP
ncbi:MAG TPA: exonuclease SbcCD subunit D [Clostridia bacterium]|nr:exonuclease SbcCD subunit D [Clostridia bacterium]